MSGSDLTRTYSDLLPCPFCGGRGVRVKSSRRWGYFVSCSCAAVGPSSASREEAVERWNARAESRQPSLSDLFGIWREDA